MFKWIFRKILLFFGNPASYRGEDFDVRKAKTIFIRPGASGIGDSIIFSGIIRDIKRNCPDTAVYVAQKKYSAAAVIKERLGKI